MFSVYRTCWLALRWSCPSSCRSGSTIEAALSSTSSVPRARRKAEAPATITQTASPTPSMAR